LWIVYFDENTGHMITTLIDDAETINQTTAKIEDNMELIAGTLKTIYKFTDKFKKTFDTFVDTDFYENVLLGADGKVFSAYYEMKEKFMPLKAELLELGMVYALCYLDALPENFIKSGEERIYLIDWEY
jgi:thiamine kinase-like enzyme